MRTSSTLLTAALLAFSFSCRAADDAKLMVAAGVNLARAVETRCESLMPGYREKFQAAYEKANTHWLLPAGIDSALLAEADQHPELASAPLVTKFDRLPVESQKRHCQQHLRGFLEAGDPSRAPPIPK